MICTESEGRSSRRGAAGAWLRALALVGLAEVVDAENVAMSDDAGELDLAFETLQDVGIGELRPDHLRRPVAQLERCGDGRDLCRTAARPGSRRGATAGRASLVSAAPDGLLWHEAPSFHGLGAHDRRYIKRIEELTVILDRQLLNIVQSRFPLAERPYAALRGLLHSIYAHRSDLELDS